MNLRMSSQIMPIADEALNEQRTIYLSSDIDHLLEERSRELRTGIPVAQQIRAALRRYLDVEPEIRHRLLVTDREARRSPIIPQKLWDSLKKHGKQAGLNLNESVQVAVALYLLREEGAVPGVEAAISDDIVARLPTEPKEVALDGDTQQKLAQLGVSLGMPQPSTPGEIVPRLIAIGDEMAGGVNLLKLPRTPCGPWQEALEDTEPFILPKFFAELIGAREGDLLVPTGGQSMREAGIPDNGAVVMRKLDGAKPEIGAIVLACARRKNGAYFYTIKFWYQDAGGKPQLRDGKLRVYHLPPDAKPEKLQAVAALVGVVGRATMGGTIKPRRAPEKHEPGEKWEFPERE